MRQVVMALAVWMAPAVWADVPARIEAEFKTWTALVGARNAVLIAQKDGETQVHLSYGWAKDAPVALASVSKSITALCAAQVISEGLLAPEDTSLDVLGYGGAGITVAQLLTHSGGLAQDQSQQLMYFWLDSTTPKADLVSQRALARPKSASNEYRYSNENYAILGEMIGQVTGESYHKACTKRVIDPAGVRGVTAGRTVSMRPWGGWDMPVAEYARIMRWGFGPDGIVGGAVADWPEHPLGGPVSYGMGMFQRAMGEGYNFWHFGAWCFPLRYNRGAYAVQWHNGWSVVAAYDVCLEDGQMGDLDRAMVRAVFQ